METHIQTDVPGHRKQAHINIKIKNITSKIRSYITGLKANIVT